MITQCAKSGISWVWLCRLGSKHMVSQGLPKYSGKRIYFFALPWLPKSPSSRVRFTASESPVDSSDPTICSSTQMTSSNACPQLEMLQLSLFLAPRNHQPKARIIIKNPFEPPLRVLDQSTAPAGTVRDSELDSFPRHEGCSPAHQSHQLFENVTTVSDPISGIAVHLRPHWNQRPISIGRFSLVIMFFPCIIIQGLNLERKHYTRTLGPW